MDHSGVQFVFSPALFPQSPLSNHTVFLHGEIVEVKQRNMELTFRVKDEKGEWEAYGEGSPSGYQVGEKVRGYGLIVPQPDGKMMLASKWIKKVEADEFDYCIRHAQQEWPIILEKHASILTLKPFELPKSKTPFPAPSSRDTKNASADDSDFISASQLNVEREYL